MCKYDDNWEVARTPEEKAVIRRNIEGIIEVCEKHRKANPELWDDWGAEKTPEEKAVIRRNIEGIIRVCEKHRKANPELWNDWEIIEPAEKNKKNIIGGNDE